MPLTDPFEFRAKIASTHARLEAVTEEIAVLPYRPGGWTRKQVLGHLIDSALNNHQRFVRAALDGLYDGPSYEQDDWVALHGYGSLSWGKLVAHWLSQNEVLAMVVRQIPPRRYAAACRIGVNPPVTLQFVIEDYLAHLEHHLQQIESS